MTERPCLAIKGLDTGYHNKQVLFGVDLTVGEGEIVALIGPNGSGKSTVLNAVNGFIPAWSGEISFEGTPIKRLGPKRRIELGMSLCLQGRRVFDDLTVAENLKMGGLFMPNQSVDEALKRVTTLFPLLKELMRRKGSQLSGGEQQMVALARALLSRPRLILLDEPSLGLAPAMVKRILREIQEINKSTRTAVLVVEQKVRAVLSICHRVYALKGGRISFAGPPEELHHPERIKKLFL